MAQNNKALLQEMNNKNLSPVQSFIREMDKMENQYMNHLKSLLGTEDEGQVRMLFACFKDSASRIPKLMSCTPMSIKNALVQAAQTNLYPGAMQECCIIPYGDNATFQPMYQGLIKLAYNSGFIKSINAEVVYDNDEFSVELGTNQHLRHIPNLNGDRGNRKCVWCVIKPVYGEAMIRVLPMSFIEGIRNRSRGAKKPDSPWNDDSEVGYDAMAKKTAIKQALKFVPKSPKLQQAISMDDDVETGKGSIIDLNQYNSKNSAVVDDLNTLEVEAQNEPELVE
jgi:recombination protein RecT